MSIYIVEYYFECSLKRDCVIANSVFEAKLKFIYTSLLTGLDDELIVIKNVLTHYYGIDKKYIAIMNCILNVSILYYWHNIKSVILDNPYLLKKYGFDELRDLTYHINTKIPSFMNIIKLKDKRKIRDLINHNCFDISAYKYKSIPIVTFISINRILKKIKNNNYWHIWRLILL